MSDKYRKIFVRTVAIVLALLMVGGAASVILTILMR